MDELKERLRVVEQVSPPDVWERAVEGRGARVALPGPRRPQRLLAVLVALVLSAGAGFGLWYAFANHGVQPAHPGTGAAVVRIVRASQGMSGTFEIGGRSEPLVVSSCRLDGSCLSLPPPVTRFLAVPTRVRVTIQSPFPLDQLEIKDGVRATGLVSLASDATTSLSAGKHVLELVGTTRGVSYFFSFGVLAARPTMLSISQTSGTHVPLLGQVTCARDGTTHVLTPQMQVSSGGAWLLVQNDSGARGLEIRTLADANQNQGGSIRSTGTTYRRVVLPPGIDLVACYQKAESIPDNPRSPKYERITVLDPKGLYLSTALGCSTPVDRRAVLSTTSSETPDQVARRVPGVLATDSVRMPGYRGLTYGGFVLPTFLVSREGRAVALLTELSKSKVIVRACPGAGIGH